MLKRKKEKIIDTQNEIKPSTVQDSVLDTSMDKVADVNSIEEFIEIKKLQNRLLEKMIKNINETDKQDN